MELSPNQTARTSNQIRLSSSEKPSQAICSITDVQRGVKDPKKNHEGQSAWIMRVSAIFLMAEDVKMFKAKITGFTACKLMCVMIAQEKITH